MSTATTLTFGSCVLKLCDGVQMINKKDNLELWNMLGYDQVYGGGVAPVPNMKNTYAAMGDGNSIFYYQG